VRSPTPKLSSHSPWDQAQLRSTARDTTSSTSARAPGNVPPVADDGENEQKNRHEKQSGGLGGVDGMAVLMLMLAVLMLVVSDGFRRNGGVHAAIVAFSVR